MQKGGYFNSIKVQLKQSNDGVFSGEFLFQFHKGTIKTESRMNLANAKDYFNSIKVQLKLSHSLLPQMQLKQFQFHKGTIKTDYALGV